MNKEQNVRAEAIFRESEKELYEIIEQFGGKLMKESGDDYKVFIFDDGSMLGYNVEDDREFSLTQTEFDRVFGGGCHGESNEARRREGRNQ